MFTAAALLTFAFQSNTLDAKVEDALRKIPLAQKLKMIGGFEGFDIMPVPEIGLHKILMNDGPLGVRGDNESHPATAYPAGVCLASTFNPGLARAFGEAVARDAKGRGVSILLGPGVNLSRIVQNGRNFEYYGEDPFLASRTAVNMIEGLQGQGVVATVKHYAANNHENDRFHDSADVSERALRELYLRAFEAAVKEANVGAVMCSYNKLNGTYTSENKWLLKTVLRDEWGFKNLVMSDWGAVHNGERAALNGMDLEMPSGVNFDPKVLAPMVASGKIPESVIDDKVRHILRTVYAFHLDAPRTPSIHDDPRNARIARRIAEEGVVLLQNKRRALPLNAATDEKIAVLGFNALQPVPVGGGSAEIIPLHRESLYAALKRASLHVTALEPGEPNVQRALATHNVDAAGVFLFTIDGKDVRKDVHDGLTVRDWTAQHPGPGGSGDYEGLVYAKFHPKKSGLYWLVSRCQGEVSVGLRWDHLIPHTDLSKPTVVKQLVSLTEGQSYDVFARFHHSTGDIHIAFGIEPAASPIDIPSNLSALRSADRVIIGVGFNAVLEAEGSDRPFDLPAEQRALLDAAIMMHKRIILVVNSGAGVDLAPYAPHVDAIVQAWYPGQEGAAVLADILTGKINPSGKLAASFPKTLTGTYYAEAYPPKKGHVKYKEDLLIGYRWFDAKGVAPLFPFGFGLSYTSFAVGKPQARILDGEIAVTTRLRNTGSVSGADVVQVYAGQTKTPDGYPVKELKAFKKLTLSAGDGTQVQVKVPVKALAHWDTTHHRWRVARGGYTLYVGDSSRNVKPAVIQIDREITFGP